MSLQGNLPRYYDNIVEMVRLLQSESHDFDEIKGVVHEFPCENTILQGSSGVISLWEKLLDVEALGNLAQRRMHLIAVIRGQGALDESKIKNIVSSFTGTKDSAVIDFVDSVLRVRVLPPEWGEIYFFNEIRNSLLPRIPSHISLLVERFYHTWQSMSAKNQSWAAVKSSYSSWGDIKIKV